MPFEPAIFDGCAICIIIRLIENRIPEAQAVGPRLEVREAEPHFQSQAPRSLPGVLHEALVGVVGDIVDAVKISLRVVVQIAVEQVGIFVTEGVGVISPHLQIAVAVVIGRLGVANPLPEDAGLHGVGGPHFGEGIADAGHVLVGVQTLRGAAVFESAGIEDQRRFLVGPAGAAKRRNLRYTVLKDPLVVITHSCAVNRRGVLEDVGEPDIGVGEHDFVRHGRAEHVGQRSGDTVGLVLAQNCSRIRNLVRLPPPQSYRELLSFLLQIVADEELRVIADAVVQAAHPLDIVLIEDRFRHVVVSAGLGGIRVGGGIQIHQRLHVLVDGARRHDSTGELRQRVGVQLSGSAAGSGRGALCCYRRRREIATDFGGGWHRGAEQAGIENLVEVLEPGKEEKLIAVVIEVRAGDQNRTAKGAAGVVVLVLRSRQAFLVVNRVIGVQDIVTGIEKARAMKVPAAGLGHRSDHRRTLLVGSVEIRHLHLDLGDHVRVGIHWRIAVAARVGHVRAIRGDIQRVARQTIVGVCGVQRALAAGIAVGIDADGLAVVVGRVVRPVRDAETGHDLDELGGVAANLNKVLQFLTRDEVGFLGAVHRSHFVNFAGDLDSLRSSSYGELGVDIALFATGQGDSRYLKGAETLRLDCQLVFAGRHRCKGEIAIGVGHGVALRTGLRIFQNDFCLRYHGRGLVGHDTRKSSVNALCP